MAEHCGQEKDVWPTSPLEEDVNNWLDPLLPRPCYGLRRLCQVNAAYMLNTLAPEERSFTTTEKSTESARQGKIRDWKCTKRGLCRNEVNRETQRCSYRAPKWKQHLLTPPSGAPGALFQLLVSMTKIHCYCLFFLSPRSENRKHSSLLDQWAKSPKASCTVHFCLAYTCRRATAAPASLDGGRAFHYGEPKAYHCWSWNTLSPAPLR